jgi:hypothetical protein
MFYMVVTGPVAIWLQTEPDIEAQKIEEPINRNLK